MKKRKNIAVITTNPESIYQTRVIDGVLDQCEKYGYNVSVFAILVHLCHFYKDYLHGEMNIYNLPNFDMFDGVIVTSISFSDNNTMPFFDELLKKLQKECDKKIVALDLPFGDYQVTYTDDRGAFKEITQHVFEEHKCKNVYFLTGVENYAVSENRLGGYLDYLEEHNMPVDKSKIFYGDFWYTSGENLADRMISGELEIPDAVICGSDHMAIGVVNRLTENGIKVPEQVIVTGYDATQEAVSNDISITTYEPKISHAAAEAVNIIHKVIEPDVPCQPISDFKRSGIRIGESCGCGPDVEYIKYKMNSAAYVAHNNWQDIDEDESLDIGRLLNSYVYEQFITAGDYMQCLSDIFFATCYIKPYTDFYLCLREDWLDMKSSCKVGYPEKMKIVLHSNMQFDDVRPTNQCFTESDKIGARSFDTKLMLPEMLEPSDKPYAYYFSPVHFSDETFGYTVLKAEMRLENRISFVFRNWVRYVNNALEIIRIRNKIQENSVRDWATGLYNRCGMYDKLDTLLPESNGKDVLVIMADMDGLKYINDNFGHNEGDFGIISISKALKKFCGKHEIAVRFAGDEFLLIGIGSYTDEYAEEKMKQIEEDIISRSANSGKNYEFSASMGYCLEKITPDIDMDKIIDIADERMYINKRKKHKNRRY